MKMQIAQILRDLIIVLAIMDTWETDSTALVIKYALITHKHKYIFIFIENAYSTKESKSY